MELTTYTRFPCNDIACVCNRIDNNNRCYYPILPARFDWLQCYPPVVSVTCQKYAVLQPRHETTKIRVLSLAILFKVCDYSSGVNSVTTFVSSDSRHSAASVHFQARLAKLALLPQTRWTFGSSVLLHTWRGIAQTGEIAGHGEYVINNCDAVWIDANRGNWRSGARFAE